MKRTLKLKKEALTELSTGELAGVAGGVISGNSCPVVTCGVPTLPVRQCIVVDPPTTPDNCYTVPWC